MTGKKNDGELVISVKDLKKYYGKSRGVEHVDLEVAKGEVYGFLGPNGAGKSTTIRTMLDFIRPTSGKILVNGMDPQKRGADVRRSVGYLPSDFGTYKTLTAEKYLRTLLAMMDVKKERIHELAEQFQLDLGMKIKSFSRGNRQKVGMVSAFMHYPQLVILDEPTTGLDPLMQQEFYKLVLAEKKAGRTVFLSSHILNEVEAICDKVSIIREGEIIVTEKMSTFKRKTGKIMTVTFEKRTDPGAFKNIEGVTEVHAREDMKNTLEMTVAGNIGSVIKALSKHDIKDLDYKETSLEHLFLHFYGQTEVRNVDNGEEEVEA